MQQLRIRSDRPERIGQVAVQLEDALRTASFANLPRNGVVYIKRLDLGRIGTRPRSSQLSRRIDRALRSLPAGAIRRGSGETELPAAEAVWFPDSVTALKAVADRILRKQPLSAWYWRRVLGLTPVTRVAVDLDRVFACAEQLQPAEPAVLSLLKHINTRGALPRLLELLPLSTLRRQLPWLVSRVVMQEQAPARARETSRSLPSGSQELPLTSDGQSLSGLPLSPAAKASLTQVLQQWQGEPERGLWCLLVLYQLESRSLSASSWRILQRRILRDEQTGSERQQRPAATPAEVEFLSQPHPVSEGAVKSVSASTSADTPRVEPGRRTITEIATAVARPIALKPNRRPFPDTDFDWAGSWLWGGEATPAAGLFFVLPIWLHLGLAKALRQHPWLEQVRFSQLLLGRLGEWLALPPGDPMLSWLSPGDPSLSGSWHCPGAWQGLLENHWQRHPPQWQMIGQARLQSTLTGRVLLSAEGPWPLAQPMLLCLADSWLRVTARWLNQQGLRLRWLVERSGVVAVTETHIDVCLPLEQSDLRLRRYALDLDPGWVPWLGRVIQYHYLRREPADA